MQLPAGRDRGSVDEALSGAGRLAAGKACERPWPQHADQRSPGRQHSIGMKAAMGLSRLRPSKADTCRIVHLNAVPMATRSSSSFDGLAASWAGCGVDSCVIDGVLLQVLLHALVSVLVC